MNYYSTPDSVLIPEIGPRIGIIGFGRVKRDLSAEGIHWQCLPPEGYMYDLIGLMENALGENPEVSMRTLAITLFANYDLKCEYTLDHTKDEAYLKIYGLNILIYMATKSTSYWTRRFYGNLPSMHLAQVIANQMGIQLLPKGYKILLRDESNSAEEIEISNLVNATTSDFSNLLNVVYCLNSTWNGYAWDEYRLEVPRYNVPEETINSIPNISERFRTQYRNVLSLHKAIPEETDSQPESIASKFYSHVLSTYDALKGADNIICEIFSGVHSLENSKIFQELLPDEDLMRVTGMGSLSDAQGFRKMYLRCTPNIRTYLLSTTKEELIKAVVKRYNLHTQ